MCSCCVGESLYCIQLSDTSSDLKETDFQQQENHVDRLAQLMNKITVDYVMWSPHQALLKIRNGPVLVSCWPGARCCKCVAKNICGAGHGGGTGGKACTALLVLDLELWSPALLSPALSSTGAVEEASATSQPVPGPGSPPQLFCWCRAAPPHYWHVKQQSGFLKSSFFPSSFVGRHAMTEGTANEEKNPVL